MSLANKLREGCVQVPKRWSGDCGEYSTVDEVKTDELMQAAADRIDVLMHALKRIADADWPGPIPLVASRADWMQEIAKEALQ